jgi:hypothetical protein
MNLRQMVVVLLGGCVCFACLTALAVPHPEWRALEREYHLGRQITLWAAPMELLSFVALILAVILTIAGAIALSDKRQE